MNISSSSRTALVLGGGGSTGNAWLIGVLAGLAEAGLDVTDADLIVGTSAGATAATQVTGAPLPELLELSLVAPPTRPGPTRPGSAGGAPAIDHLARLTANIAASSDAVELRHRLATSARELDAASDGSWTARWRAMVAPRLPHPEWPDRPVQLTALDAETAEGVVFDRESGVDLVDAVAASTSSGYPYRIGGGLYLDGGFRTNAENADLATGYDRALVLSPFGGRSLVPAAWGTHLSTQLDALRASGSAVETVFPGAESEHLFGPNGMDLSLRPAAARAGHDQGIARAEQLATFWTGA